MAEALQRHFVQELFLTDSISGISRVFQRGEHVDLFLGNHAAQNHTKENYEKLLLGGENPFIDDKAWGIFLDETEKKLTRRIKEDARSNFLSLNCI